MPAASKAGVAVDVTVQGTRLSLADRVRVVPSLQACGTAGAETPAAELLGTLAETPNTAPTGTAGTSPTATEVTFSLTAAAGRFRVCYCRALGDLCDAGADFYFDAGVIVIGGPDPEQGFSGVGGTKPRNPLHFDIIGGGRKRVSDAFIDKNSASCT